MYQCITDICINIYYPASVSAVLDSKQSDEYQYIDFTMVRIVFFFKYS